METDNQLFESRHDIYVINKNDTASIVKVIFDLFEFTQDYILESFADPENPQISEDKAKEIIESIKGKKWADINIFLEIIDILFIKISAISIATEDFYIDREYRDSYYFHYSQKHKEISRYCTRLIFFSNDMQDILVKTRLNEEDYEVLQGEIIGSMVIRPLNGRSIGRTLLSTDLLFKENKAYIRKTKYSINYRGKSFDIKAFPFRMQDGVTTTCAEITLLNLLDYYSNEYVDYKFAVPSDIHELVKQDHFDRHIPANGLSYYTISRVLYKSSFAPKLYLPQTNTSKVKKFLSYYVESGIPVAVGLSPDDSDSSIGHSIVCVGHGECDFSLKLQSVEKTTKNKVSYINSANTHDIYIFQDDTKAPYCTYKIIGTDRIKYIDKCYGSSTEPKKISCLLVPLYKRMYMDAAKAESTILQILEQKEYAPNNGGANGIGESDENPIVFRLFLASSRHFKSFRIDTIKDDWLCSLYQEIPLPQFIWICELYSKDGYGQKNAFGEIVLDATYSGPNLLESCLLINYPDRHLAQDISNASLFTDEFGFQYDQLDWIETPKECRGYVIPAYQMNLR